MAGLLQDLFGIQPSDPSDLVARALNLNAVKPVGGDWFAPGELDPAAFGGAVQGQPAPMASAPVMRSALPPATSPADGPGVVPIGTTEAPPEMAPVPAPQPMAQPAPAAAPAPSGPSLGDRFGRFLAAGSPGSLARGLGEATYGADRVAETQNLTVQLLTQKGMDPTQARAVARSPEMLKAILPTMFGPKPGTIIVPPGAALASSTGQELFRNSGPKPGFHNATPGATVLDGDGKPIFTAPSVNENAKPPTGYEWIDPNDKSKGVAAIPGGPATRSTGEVAGKLALMRTAREGIKATREKLEKNWGFFGSVQSGIGNAIPALAGEIGEAQRNVRAGIEAALRIMTGAAAPEAEVVRYENMFMPNSRDNEKTAKQKMDLLEGFMDKAEELARQSHLTREEMAGPKGIPPPRTGGSGADPLGIR